MLRSLSFLLLLVSLIAPATAPAQGLDQVGGQAGLEARYGDHAGSAETGLALFGSTDMRSDTGWGLQADATAGYGATSAADEGYASLAVHPYTQIGPSLFFGLYGAAGQRPDPRYTIGTELARTPARGFGFDLFFGETRGGGGLENGYTTNKSVDLFWTTSHDSRYGIYGRKETLNIPGDRDQDFYDYGLHAEIPLNADHRTMLTARLGQIRLDAEGEVRSEAALGVSRLLGRVPHRPTFGLERAVLPGLIRN